MAKVRTPCAYSSTELKKNLIERFIQQSISRIGLMSVSMTIFFHVERRIVIGAAYVYGTG
jgi:hypothetical protein